MGASSLSRIFGGRVSTSRFRPFAGRPFSSIFIAACTGSAPWTRRSRWWPRVFCGAVLSAFGCLFWQYLWLPSLLLVVCCTYIQERAVLPSGSGGPTSPNLIEDEPDIDGGMNAVKCEAFLKRCGVLCKSETQYGHFTIPSKDAKRTAVDQGPWRKIANSRPQFDRPLPRPTLVRAMNVMGDGRRAAAA